MHKITVIIFVVLIALVATETDAQEMTPIKSPSRCKHSFKLQPQTYSSNVKTHSRSILPFEMCPQKIIETRMMPFSMVISDWIGIDFPQKMEFLHYNDWLMNKLYNEFLF